MIKKHEKITDIQPIRIYLNTRGNRTAFKGTTVYYLELLISEIMVLFGSIKSKITKIKMFLI